jgi:hypothetical protein
MEFQFRFEAASLEDLSALSYAIDECHSGIPGWKIIVNTDCAASLSFRLEGPVDPQAGDELAGAIYTLAKQTAKRRKELT